MDVTKLMNDVNTKYSWNMELKPQQLAIVTNILQGKNTIGVLPTGYGKSMAYMLPPLLLDEADPDHAPHVAIVISPLRSIMFDQLERCNKMGIIAAMVTKRNEMTSESMDAVRNCTASIIFSSPEALQAGDWLQYIKGHNKRVCLLAFDEIHCLSEWGSDFRPDYLKSVELRSLFSNAPCVGLSATVTPKILTDIKQHLKLEDHQVTVVSLPPDRPNIFLNIVHQTSYDYERDFLWLVKDLDKQQDSYPKTLLFAQTIGQVSDIYEFIKTALGQRAFVDEECIVEKRLISMYHGQISEKLQHFTLENFRRSKCNLRVVVCTVAFGMGVEIPDIKQVIHWGKSKSLLSHWQEIGRCGRDGEKSSATWYPKSTAGEDKKVFDVMKHDEEVCIRKTILETFLLPYMDLSCIAALDSRTLCVARCTICSCQLCICCSHCAKKCPCN